MKFLVVSDFIKNDFNKSEIEIEISNEPIVNFEKLKIATKDGSEAYISCNHKWNLLESTSDLTALIEGGLSFNLFSDKWLVKRCWVLEDRKSIYFKDAISQFHR